jgi:hypothetical protein
VAVGLGAGHCGHGNGIAGADPVLDDNRLTDLRGGSFKDRARHNVERTSRALGNKRLDRPGRPRLRECRTESERAQSKKQKQTPQQ